MTRATLKHPAEAHEPKHQEPKHQESADRHLATKYFTPQSDITPFELATIMEKYLFHNRGISVNIDEFNTLHDTVKKHLTDAKPTG